MKKLLIGATVMLAACGLSEDKFAEDFETKFCDALTVCGTECPDTSDGEDGEDTTADCEFDKDKAQDCLDGLDAITEDDCDETTGFFTVPTACGEVYDCPAADGEDGEE